MEEVVGVLTALLGLAGAFGWMSAVKVMHLANAVKVVSEVARSVSGAKAGTVPSIKLQVANRLAKENPRVAKELNKVLDRHNLRIKGGR